MIIMNNEEIAITIGISFAVIVFVALYHVLKKKHDEREEEESERLFTMIGRDKSVDLERHRIK